MIYKYTPTKEHLKWQWISIYIIIYLSVSFKLAKFENLQDSDTLVMASSTEYNLNSDL